MDLNMKVLVVDDFAEVRQIVINILQKIGFKNISDADDGTTALKMLHKEKYGLVLCDWNMPVMSGLELLKTVRADDSLKDLPFVMITAYAEKQSIIDAVQAGVTNYIVKPFTAETVTEKLAKVFG